MASHRISSAASDATYSSCASDSDVESNATSTYDTTPNVSYHDGELIWTGDGDVEKVVRLKDEEVVTVMKTRGGGYQIFTIPPPEMSLNNQPFELSTIYIANLPQAFFDKHAFAQLPAWLDPALGNEVHILISTLSGTGLAPAFFDSILPPILKATGLDEESYKVIRTDSAESVKDFATSVLLAGANQGRKQTVLMLSGDGGMVDTINGLLEFGERSSSYIKPILAQLPLGTGNALFHSLHRTSTVPSITSPYIQGLRTLLYGSPKPLPLLSTTFSPGARLLSNEGQTATPILNDTLYGAVVASYGLHATLVADSDTTAYRKHGRDRFGIAANNLLFPEGGALPHAYQADVSLLIGEKREPIQRDTHGYVLATLVSNLEKGFTINPDSKPLDGQLRVVHFGATSGAQAMEVMKAAYGDGKHVGMEWEGEQGEGTMKVGYEAVDGVRIDFKEEGENWKWRRCCVDGLIVGVEEGGWMEIRKVKDGKECVDVVVDL